MRHTALRPLPALSFVLLAACTINIGTSSPPSPSPVLSSGSPGVGATDQPAGQVVGSGVVKTESRPVEDIVKVLVRGNGRLIIDQNGSETLSIEAEDNILPLLISEVEDGQLTLGLRPGSSILTYKPIVYRLTVKDLTAIDMSGSASVEALNLETQSLAFNGGGSADARLAGRAGTQNITLSGSGNFDGEGLAGDNVSVRVSGSSDVIVNAAKTLNVDLSGSSDVRYVGSPTVTQKVSGSGDVQKR